ncbi:glycosyltransferase [Granulimonas faecalis]|uniref:glycosyltransferase n=1 Tax=Granulimonas faecalis TaxID=2894155 RepID=UPI003513DDC0
MIFVTVGTHEQQFDRLVRAVDELKRNGTLTEPIFVQTGYSTYVPTHCEHSRFVPFKRMKEMMAEADVVVTHGGPSSFIEAMAAGKVPVVVPRRGDLGEHVNDHQADFVRIVAERQGGIVPVYDIAELPKAIELSREMSRDVEFESHNAEFCNGLRRLIEEL